METGELRDGLVNCCDCDLIDSAACGSVRQNPPPTLVSRVPMRRSRYSCLIVSRSSLAKSAKYRMRGQLSEGLST
jgi:hypothetical protein